MRSPLRLTHLCPVLIVALAAMANTLTAAPTNSASLAKAETLVVQPPFIAPAIPQSTFVMPKKRAEGRDPFFPKSDRVYGVDTTVKPVIVKSPVAEIVVRGISGTQEQPLAILNSTTFTTGEENDVLTSAGRMRIRCIEINMSTGTVIIQVGGERRTLRLAPQK